MSRRSSDRDLGIGREFQVRGRVNMWLLPWKAEWGWEENMTGEVSAVIGNEGTK